MDKLTKTPTSCHNKQVELYVEGVDWDTSASNKSDKTLDPAVTVTLFGSVANPICSVNLLIIRYQFANMKALVSSNKNLRWRDRRSTQKHKSSIMYM